VPFSLIKFIFLLQGLVAGLLEVFGLCFFAVVILLDTHISPVLRILMMNGVFIIPVLWQVYKNRSCQEQYSGKQLGIFALAFILEIAGVAVLMYEVRKRLARKSLILCYLFWGEGAGEGEFELLVYMF